MGGEFVNNDNFVPNGSWIPHEDLMAINITVLYFSTCQDNNQLDVDQRN